MKKKHLIILPGWGSNKQKWDKFIKKASEHFEVHCIELPCFGKEPCPDTIWGVQDYSNFVYNKIKSYQTDETVILAHSFGGQVAAHLCGTHADICKKLIFVAPAIIRPKIATKRLIFSGLAKTGNFILSIPILNLLKPIARKILYKAADSPDYGKTNGMKRKIFQKITREDMSEIAKNIKTKTLFISGSNDNYVPLKRTKYLANSLPNASLIVLPKATHGLHHEPYINDLYKHIHNFVYNI